jgi:hypothetical protein
MWPTSVHAVDCLLRQQRCYKFQGENHSIIADQASLVPDRMVIQVTERHGIITGNATAASHDSVVKKFSYDDKNSTL